VTLSEVLTTEGCKVKTATVQELKQRAGKARLFGSGIPFVSSSP